MIESLPKGSWAAYIRGVTPSAIPLKFPFGKLEALPQMNSRERAALLDRMRERYAIQHIKLENEGWERDYEVAEPTEPSFVEPG